MSRILLPGARSGESPGHSRSRSGWADRQLRTRADWRGESELKKEGPDAEMERGRKIMQESLCFLHSVVKFVRDFSSS